MKTPSWAQTKWGSWASELDLARPEGFAQAGECLPEPPTLGSEERSQAFWTSQP